VRIRYYCDAETRLPHIGKHGVREREARHLLHPRAILKAIEGVSGANALSHVYKIAMEQAKTRTPQTCGGT
jgi:hypothetical protein